jgi:uncharacterized protein YhhL (DUF1145 family)
MSLNKLGKLARLVTFLGILVALANIFTPLGLNWWIVAALIVGPPILVFVVAFIITPSEARQEAKQRQERVDYWESKRGMSIADVMAEREAEKSSIH